MTKLNQRLMKEKLQFEDGKVFTIRAIRHTEKRANSIADGVRARGMLARVVRYAAGINIWGVYTRKA